MSLSKTLTMLATFAAACLTPAGAQIFWSNQSPAGISDTIWSVTYGNGTFAAVTNAGNLLTSTDGLTWSNQNIEPGVTLSTSITGLISIAYGSGTWVAVGAGGTILVSSDLKTWVNAKSATTTQLNGVLSNGSIWVAVGDGATILTSPDAINWTAQAAPAGITGFLHGITWDQVNSVFLISGAATTSGSGVSAGGVMLQLSVSGTSVSVSQTIPDTSSPLEAVLYESVAIPNTVAVGWDIIISGSYAATSPTPATGVIPNVIYRGLTYGNGYWVTAGEQGTILSSTDAVNWTQRFSGNSPATLTTATLLGATYSSTLQRFVVVGANGTILVSSSSPTVFGNVSTRGYVSSTQTFIGGFVIEGTAPRTVLIRGDGPVLSAFSVPNPLADPVLTVYDNNGTVIATNTGWATNMNPATISTAALEVGAFALPNPSPDSALLLTLQPGAYTAQITSAKGNSGIALFEAYTD
jgi:hypothetical protein